MNKVITTERGYRMYSVKSEHVEGIPTPVCFSNIPIPKNHREVIIVIADEGYYWTMVRTTANKHWKLGMMKEFARRFVEKEMAYLRNGTDISAYLVESNKTIEL